ncbi:MAG: glycosyltransferase, partial [Longimicrobiaceae bacterium]
QTLIHDPRFAGGPAAEPLATALRTVQEHFRARWGNSDGFPERGDAQDHVYLPLVDEHAAVPPAGDTTGWPSLSIVTPSFNQGRFLRRTLDSLLGQEYPRLEAIVMDGGSKDDSVDVLRSLQSRLAHWESVPDRGPAHALNKGFARATGEVLGWVNSDDMLSAGALAVVGRAFAADPELDLVYGNALYVDEHDRLFAADHGRYRTGLYYGEMQPWQRVPAFWEYVHAVPQPTVFFRRRLLDACGGPDESYSFIFDFELFFRFARQARRVLKLERTQAFYRIHSAAKTADWDRFLEELYRFSRPYWPPRRSPDFQVTLRGYLNAYALRRFGGSPRGPREMAHTAIATAMAVSGRGNPERLARPRPKATVSLPPPPVEVPPSRMPVPRIEGERRFRSFWCGIQWPRYPGHFGGEIRDFHLLWHLLEVSTVEFFAVHNYARDARTDLSAFVSALHTPETSGGTLQRGGLSRLAGNARRLGFPVVGTRYHHDAAEQIPYLRSFTLDRLQAALREQAPDFLFVSSQANPVGILLDGRDLETRFVLASYDVEASRLRTFADSASPRRKPALALEARRAARFERESVERYDGVIVVSELDRDAYVRYGFEPERVLILENGVDPRYFAFQERDPAAADVVLVGTYTYRPNLDAAWRLVRGIMPGVRAERPQAGLWIVGQGAPDPLRAVDDGRLTHVTGSVPDVRPYLARAAVSCIPLSAGAGTKYKVLEALSAGVPLVCTRLAAEGLEVEDGRHLLLAESDEELAGAVRRLLGDRALAARLAVEGRRLVESRYAWEVNLGRMDDWLARLRALPRRPR